MVALGILCIIIGGVLYFSGYNINNDVEAQIESFFNDGVTNPGSTYEAFGILLLVVGFILVIVGVILAIRDDNEAKRIASTRATETTNTTSKPENKSPTCKKCGAVITSDSRFCPECGEAIVKEQEEPAKVCSHCGRELPKDDARFCSYCGTDISTPDHSFPDIPIRKDIPIDELKQTEIKESVVTPSVYPLIKRAFIFIEDGEWVRADDFCEQVLNIDPECAYAYLGKLMIKLRVRRQEGLKYCVEPFDRYNDYQKAIRFADTELRSTLQGYIDYINNRYKNDTYSKAIKAMSEANTENEYKDVAEIFASISDYLDSGNLAKTCYGKAEEARKDDIYSKAQKEFDQAHKFAAIATSIESYKIAKELFQSIPGWKEADDMARRCNQKVEEYRAKVKADRLEKERQAELARLKEEKNAKRTKKIVVIALSFILLVIVFTVILNTVIIPNNKYNNALALMNSGEYAQAISAFEALDGYSDSATKIAELNTAILNNKYNVALALMDAGKYTEAISEFETLDGYKDSVNKIEECNINIYGEEVWNKIKSLNVGDTYEFGSYEQDNIKSNGQEDIKWLVLSKKETKILVISKYALDCKPYNTYSFTDGTWGTCTLREWLNNDFINAAFSEDEKVMIPTITVSKYSTGNAIKDQVFLLSIKEANEYFSSDSARQCKPTAYAVANGAYADNSTGNCRWWLLSPSYIMNYAALVYSGGDVDERGDYVLSDDIAVRPAMWIDLNA